MSLLIRYTVLPVYALKSPHAKIPYVSIPIIQA
jgi:hypothetical protein